MEFLTKGRGGAAANSKFKSREKKSKKRPDDEGENDDINVSNLQGTMD